MTATVEDLLVGSKRGMAEVEKPPVLAARGGVWFRQGNAEIHVGVEPDFRPAATAHPANAVDDLDRVAEAVAAAGMGRRLS